MRHETEHIETCAQQAALHGFAIFGLYLWQEVFKNTQHVETARGEVAEYAIGAYEIVVEP